ncbi:MAG: enoyl-CoA hydratase/isomerase family protein [Arenimonas sp.]
MTSSGWQSLSIEHDGAVATLQMQRPEVHNAFDAQLVAELTQALLQLDQDASVRAVVLSGAGSTFSAGADLNWMLGMARATELENRKDSMRLAKLMHTLNFLGKPTIAKVNGSSYGGGVGLVACCDIAIGASGAKFSLSEVKLGLVPAVISPYVIAAIGERHARRLFITAEVFSAEEAQRIGLLHLCVPGAELDAAVERTLHWLLKGGPIAQREAKQLIQKQSGMTSVAQKLVDRHNARLIARLRVSPEGQEGLAAFLDKRQPDWSRGDGS